jgi:phosphohistidine phosphatase SixA
MAFQVDIMRHAESEANVGINKADPALTERGRTQASSVTGEWDLVVLSSLRRTHETLTNSGIKTRWMITSELCREHLAGGISDHLEGETPSNERLSGLYERIDKFKDWLRTQYAYLQQQGITQPRILVISHAIFICHATSTWRGIYNCEMLRWEIPVKTA